MAELIIFAVGLICGTGLGFLIFCMVAINRND